MSKDYSNYDYVPGHIEQGQNNVPVGFEFWKPEWSIEERIVNGRKVKVIVKPVVEKKEEAKPVQAVETKPLFKCHTCEFKSESEQEIKAHVDEHIVKAVQENPHLDEDYKKTLEQSLKPKKGRKKVGEKSNDA